MPAQMKLAWLLAPAWLIPAWLIPALPADISPARAEGAVNVLYAGSLVNLMEHGVGEAFDKTGSDSFKGFAAGSNALANQIKGKLRHGDVFISAVPRVNDGLMGAANGDWVTWYATFAQSPVVIGYNAQSRFAADINAKPWYEVMQEPGIRIGRTDPKLDPKGALTVELLNHAEQVYKIPGLAQKVLGAPDNTGQIMPEETLVGRLQSGQLDAGFFYSTETSDLKIPNVALQPEVALSAHYTIAVLHDAANPAGAARFVSFLLGPQGREIMHQHGLETVKPAVSGDASGLPPAVRAEVDAAP